jgi:tetratricopeptide (TPR) repeat protein
LLDLVKEEDSSSKDTYIFKGYVLGGIVFFLREKTDEALECLLKALRLEINEKGGDSLRLIEVYYWLGETYAKLKKYYLAKNYYSKAYRLYGKHEVLEPKLLANICLQLGLANIRQEEYAEADKLFEIGVGKAEESGDFSIYIQILLKSAENDLAMGSYKQTLGKYARVFKIFRECKCQ